VIVQRLGGVEVEPGSARSVVAEITDDDFIVGESITFNRFKTDTQRVNTVVPRYVEPSQKWADHAAPIRRVLADLIEDGGPREESLTLTAVTSGTQAQRVGEIRRRQDRLERTASGTLGPRFAELEDGDWIGWTSVKHLKGERVVFRINSYSLPASWRNTISLEEISAACFDWNASVDEQVPGAVAVQQAPPARGAPSASDWTLTDELLTGTGGAVPALVFSGAVGASYVDQIVFEYQVAGGASDAWIDGGTAVPSVRRKEITSVRPNTAYKGAVSYVIGGIPTDRLVLGPVTVGATSIAPGALDPPTELTGSQTGPLQVTLTWRNPRASSFDHITIFRGGASDSPPIVGGLGAPMTVMTNPPAAGSLVYFLRAYDVDGVSYADSDPITVVVT
jgi:hypothetical protein